MSAVGLPDLVTGDYLDGLHASARTVKCPARWISTPPRPVRPLCIHQPAPAGMGTSETCADVSPIPGTDRWGITGALDWRMTRQSRQRADYPLQGGARPVIRACESRA